MCQFSFVCDGSLYRAPRSAAWREARDIAAAALAGYVEQSVGSATHYHADYVAPRWAPMLSKVAKLGAHIFYRWPGAWGLPAAFTGRYIGEPTDPAALRPALRAATLDAVGDAVRRGTSRRSPVRRSRARRTMSADCSTRRKGWTLNIPMPARGRIASRGDRRAAASRAAPATAAAEPSAQRAGAGVALV